MQYNTLFKVELLLAIWITLKENFTSYFTGVPLQIKSIE